MNEKLIETIKTIFGDLLETIKGTEDYLKIELKNEFNSEIYGISTNNSIAYIEERLKEIKDDFICTSIKKEKLFHDSIILKKFIAQFHKTDLSIVDMRQIIEFCARQGINMIYQYSLLGIIDNFKLTEKSIIAYDICDNRIIFNNRSYKNYSFYYDAIKVRGGIDNENIK